MANAKVPASGVVELGADNTVTLPENVAQAFKPADRFLVIMQGDTVILKRIDPLSYLDQLAATPGSTPALTIDEIDAIIHEVRQQQDQDK